MRNIQRFEKDDYWAVLENLYHIALLDEHGLDEYSNAFAWLWCSS